MTYVQLLIPGLHPDPPTPTSEGPKSAHPLKASLATFSMEEEVYLHLFLSFILTVTPSCDQINILITASQTVQK